MRREIGIRTAGQIGNGEFVLVPQNGMVVLLAHEVTGTEPVDAGRYVEIATSDGLRHLVGADDRIVVMLRASASKVGRMSR